MYECYNAENGILIGHSSVKPEKGEEHSFGDDHYVATFNVKDLCFFQPKISISIRTSNK
ncbi:MAG: hypothetical protein K0R18_177 [Bacillales bacterium]|jgi:hypothetical protein|nr:hypothetical protein [Bacillales bacterium]